MESLTANTNGDAWWRFSTFVSVFNHTHSETVMLPGSTHPKQTHSYLNTSFIAQKRQPLGTKFKHFVCSETGVMLWLEIQEGRNLMKPKKHFATHGSMVSYYVIHATEAGRAFVSPNDAIADADYTTCC
eukprot:scaffold117490_cov61-Attheya_sp.AAC.4